MRYVKSYRLEKYDSQNGQDEGEINIERYVLHGKKVADNSTGKIMSMAIPVMDSTFINTPQIPLRSSVFIKAKISCWANCGSCLKTLQEKKFSRELSEDFFNLMEAAVWKQPKRNSSWIFVMKCSI